ncbi:MAG TPA: hypothetical protein VFW83_05745, partial [Bryobacteraceae bacterium]|nr:hypothetical protein [Bryobacteraceae bacterium]
MADIAAIAGASRQQSPSARKLAGEFYFTSALVLLWLLGFYVLPGPAPLAPGLDPSWQAALTEAFLHHLQFGKDIVFTHGPWGFLNRPRGNPSIYPWLVSGRLVLALGMSAGYTWIAL